MIAIRRELRLTEGLPGRSNGAPRNIQLALKLYF
jgi:hypothetical protein